MRREGHDRHRRLRLRELREDGLAALSALAPAWIVETDAGCEVGPAVPTTFLDAIEVVEVADDLAGAAVVHPVLGRIERAVRGEGEAIWIAKAPGDHLKIRTVERAAEDRSGGLHGARDDLLRRGLGPEWHERAGADGSREVAEDIPVLVVPAGQDDVVGRYVVCLRVLREPRVCRVVGSDDAGVGHAPDAGVELAVGTDDGVVRLVVADARESVDDRRPPAVRLDADDAIGVAHDEGLADENGARDRAGREPVRPDELVDDGRLA